MEIKYRSIIEELHSIDIKEIPDLTDISNFIHKSLPVDYEDLIISIVFVDLTREPVALVSKYRSDNFTGFKEKYYNRLGHNLQTISQNSLIHHLVKDQNLVVIENLDELEEDAPVSDFERDFMLDNEWKSAIFHSLFHQTITYGYIAMFTTSTYLKEFEIELILEYCSKIFPEVSEMLFPIAYKWKSNIYEHDIKEMETNLSDFILAITGRGIIVRMNDLSNYYLGISPNDALGKNLKDVSQPLYEGIMFSINEENPNDYPVEVELKNKSGQTLILELTTWETSLTSDETIVCFARDITLLKLYEGIVDRP